MLPAPWGSLHTHDAARSGFLPGRVRRSTDTPGPSPVSVTERCARAFLSLLGQVCWLVLRTEQKSCPGPTRQGALHAPQPLVRLLLGGVCSDLWPSFNRSTCFFIADQAVVFSCVLGNSALSNGAQQIAPPGLWLAYSCFFFFLI